MQNHMSLGVYSNPTDTESSISDVNADLGIGRKADDIICKKYNLSVRPFESYIKKIRSDGSYKRILNPIKVKNIEEELFQMSGNSLSGMVHSSS